MAWIRAKYVERRFVSTDVDASSCTALFHEACRNDSLLSMLFYFAHGADINTRFPPDNEFASPPYHAPFFPPLLAHRFSCVTKDMPALHGEAPTPGGKHVPSAERC